MSFGTITPAAVNNKLEVAPALANLNFDFSLWKVEAPKEFKGVGSALSSARRDDAENGLPHATAQKLGALFDTVVPPAPNLLRAYGQRASEISQVVSLAPAAQKSYGAFSGHAGSDATSIWAAATSGRPTAMAAHLLACFLARIWDGPEATSIWVELVRRRKAIIRAEFDQTSFISLLAMEAAKQEITRAQIAEWDASARSWLRTADTVKCRQYKQLKLIIDNLNTSVNRISDTYNSVIAAWKNSLTQMEGLIEGVSQQAVGGDIILAISSWHLYPDMRVVAPSTAHVSQHDPIFASGGILTIGLEMRDSQQIGVSWSLPLACLRYYGDPVMTSRSVNTDERSRLTLEELLLSIVGCFLGAWGIVEADTSRSVKWLSQLGEILDQAVASGSKEAITMVKGKGEFSWFSLLLSAARSYQRSSESEQQASRKLVALGRKHGKKFLGLPAYPFFGLTHRGNFVGLMNNEEERIQFLRRVARDVQRTAGHENHHLIIRYKPQNYSSSAPVYEFATALPLIRKSTKRYANQNGHQSQGHCRWLFAWERFPNIVTLDRRYLERIDASGGYVRAYFADLETRASDVTANDPFFGMDRRKIEIEQQNFTNRSKIVAAAGELVCKRDYENIQDHLVQKFPIFWPSIYEDNEITRLGVHEIPFYKIIYGELGSAALFALEARPDLINFAHPHAEDVHGMFDHFEESKIDSCAVVRQLSEHFQVGNPKADSHLQCAKGISTAAALYREFTNATVDVRVLQSNLHQCHWLQKATSNPSNYGMMATLGETPASLLPYQLDRASSFACIAMFESGIYDSDPYELANVMAMSSGDSIYTSVALLSDPSEQSYSNSIARVRGNIGRPGIAYLVPPRDPLIKKVAISEWPNISREDFDGTLRNSFTNTSLHLSFTGARTRVNLEFSGAQDDDVYMLETLISVFDKGRWIADLDPLKTFSSLELCILPRCSDQQAHCHKSEKRLRMTNIENWLELIDTPESHYAVVQAHRNWEARLAGASISVALKLQTIVLPPQVCWSCFEEATGKLCQDQRQQVIVIS